MKPITIEEKAKAYDDIIEGMAHGLAYVAVSHPSRDADARIRSFFHYFNGWTADNSQINSILEKVNAKNPEPR